MTAATTKITLNPDKEYVSEIKRKLKENGGYCPCKLTKTKENHCMCKEFIDLIESGNEGYCHCGLYYCSRG